ncbi:uncharacterized protein LOC110548988 isoform X2 [Meriones unguiculatus]|uniref:uncharacterized protein LOC110548988 isoform X2 n=1 Tax=Meriones unguiculatus TaxID=10047 RepID=UPI00293EA693|nr:uncharacterized protein LOC110548988 isoform X2 [Meriones unguiculatus]
MKPRSLHLGGYSLISGQSFNPGRVGAPPSRPLLPRGQGREEQWRPAPRTVPSDQRKDLTSPCALAQGKMCFQIANGLVPTSRSGQRRRCSLAAFFQSRGVKTLLAWSL